MKYRALTATGDYNMGASGQFLLNSPAAVAQAVLTRLRLVEGEWFLDNREGTPYPSQVLGYATQGTRDLAIKERILGTQGVTEIIAYSSSVDRNRTMTVFARINTIYGPTDLTASA